MNKHQTKPSPAYFAFDQSFITATAMKLDQASAEDGIIPEG